MCNKRTAVFVCIVVAASAANAKAVTENGRRFEYEGRPPLPDRDRGNARREGVHTSGPYETETIVRPVSYTYFSANIRDALASRTGVESRIRLQQNGAPFRPRHGSQIEEIVPPPRENVPILADNAGHRSHVASYREETGTLPPISRRTVRFPLDTVLPGNSLGFDLEPYPKLLQAVNTFSDLNPSRKAGEGILVTHNAVSLPATDEGVTTVERTRIADHGAYGGKASYPYTEFTEVERNTRGDGGRSIERTRRLRNHQTLDERPSESRYLSETGRGNGGTRYDSERGEAEEEDHESTKGGKGEKKYEKDHKYHKQGKGYHDKERDSSNSEENLETEKNYRKEEEFFGKHRKAEKGGKGKKYGEGGKHKKGHTTRGEHNIIKKDEFIKNTKFYDEDHGGGEHEEHGEFYGQHEESKGGSKEGENKESNREKKKQEKNKSRDKGHEEEQRDTSDTGSGHEKHFETEEEYGGTRGGHTFKKWAKNMGEIGEQREDQRAITTLYS